MSFFRFLIILHTLASSYVVASAQTVSPAPMASPVRESCSLYPAGATLTDAHDLSSVNGLLRVTLTIRNSTDPYGHMRYCYTDEHGNQAPTLRLRPGDTLALTLKNAISVLPLKPTSKTNGRHAAQDPCTGGVMAPSSTNLHFHGLVVPPVCHQDETLKTMIEPGSSFEYRIQIPTNQPPGLYWYHPHIHGFSEDQILGGASGALIVEGIEQVNPQVAGLAERVLVIRDEKMPEVSSQPPDMNRPTKELSINYVPVPYPKYPPAVTKLKPLERQFWRVVNAGADTYLDLRIEFAGKPQSLNLVALDGVPLRYGEQDSQGYMPEQTHILLPPAGRAEFVFTGPPQGVPASLVTNYVFRGASDENGRAVIPVNKAQAGLRTGQDDIDPSRPLAALVAANNAPTVHTVPGVAISSLTKPLSTPLAALRPVRKRKLYFSEKTVDPANPAGTTLFFITEEGQQPAIFNTASAPNITVHQGDIEDWIIENRSQESHDFHIHQLHFLVVGSKGVPWEEPALRDTINLPAWDGTQRYPSVTLRMDFRDPQIVGTFPYHCHIMQHIDGGMMGTVQVVPAAGQATHD